MKKVKSMLQLKKSLISNLDSGIVTGGRPTTDQDTMKYCGSSGTLPSGQATISYSNCGQCGGW